MLLVTASEKFICKLGKFLFIELDGNRWIPIVVSAVTWIWRRLVPGHKLLGIGKMVVHVYALSSSSVRRLLIYPRHLLQPDVQSSTTCHSKEAYSPQRTGMYGNMKFCWKQRKRAYEKLVPPTDKELRPGFISSKSSHVITVAPRAAGISWTDGL
jgi:hypothetical protein